jgi:tetratricopeptide (TPR) repeat protein
MLRYCLLCGVVALSTSCKTLHEADAAMSAWTRDRLAPEPAASAEPEAKEARAAEASKNRAGGSARAAAARRTAEEPEAVSSTEQAALAGTSGPRASEAAAEALFESGHEAMSAGDYATACARFEESNRLDPAVGSLLNLAVCEEKRGRLATAWQLYKRVMSELVAGDDRYPIAQRRASALRPRVPRLTLQLESGASKQTTVRYGQVTLGRASFRVPLPFDPGEHTLHVQAPKREPRVYQVRMAEGETKLLRVAPGDPE